MAAAIVAVKRAQETADVYGAAGVGSYAHSYEEQQLEAWRLGSRVLLRAASLARFLWRYCNVKPHSSLGGRTPHEVYIETEPCSSLTGLTMSGDGTVQ